MSRAADQKNKNQAMAADLLARGFWHGRRQSKPQAHSGGLLKLGVAGSSKYQRALKAGQLKKSPIVDKAELNRRAMLKRLRKSVKALPGRTQLECDLATASYKSPAQKYYDLFDMAV